ncbi:YslB family protein [Lysinibacillus sp. KU-BSD001]|uniref:YslB family protein n=1 Tax=Lysinibacillus sp. KU-BSD001 TaxID=3141328 RepID=UPI0036E1A28B
MNDSNMKTIPTFGYELIRDNILRSVLGKHEEEVLYWAGKELARKFPLFSMAEAASFFEQAGWGSLSLEKEGKDFAIFLLIGDADILKFEERCFRIEAGFLAEQTQKLNGYLTECYEEKNIKHGTVTFNLKWDLKEPIK